VSWLADLGAGAQYSRLVVTDIQRFGRIAREANIKAE